MHTVHDRERTTRWCNLGLDIDKDLCIWNNASYVKCNLVGWCKKNSTTLLMHWSYIFLASTDPYDTVSIVTNQRINGKLVTKCVPLLYKLELYITWCTLCSCDQVNFFFGSTKFHVVVGLIHSQIYWGSSKMANVLQTTFSKVFSWMKFVTFDQTLIEIVFKSLI